MAIESIGKTFVQEFVIGFGFLSGLWIYAGINPESEVINVFADVVKTLMPNSGFTFLFWLIPIIALIFTILGAFVISGWAGIVSIGLAFLGGIFVDTSFGVFVLVIAIIIGLIAPNFKG